MSHKGTHTWQITHHYHRCPECGKILESREDFTYRMGKYEKDLQCPHCHHFFTLTRSFPKRIGPIFGDPTTFEIDWRG